MGRPPRHKENNDQKALVAFVDRGQEALKLRAAGKTYRQIMEALGYQNPSSAYQAVKRTLEETKRELSEEVRNMELHRLDILLNAVWPRALEGDPKSVQSALSILDRRSRYLGLDAPVLQDNVVTVEFVKDWRRGQDSAAQLTEETNTTLPSGGKLPDGP